MGWVLTRIAQYFQTKRFLTAMANGAKAQTCAARSV